jgi:SAM-dependent methyltransferase
MRRCLKCELAFPSDKWACPACGHEPFKLSGIESYAPEFSNGGGGFKSEYFPELAKLEADNFWFIARNQLILHALRTYKPAARSFFEVGCGTGFVLSGIAKVLPNIALSGSEIFMDGLSHAAARIPSAHFMQMDARHVPFQEEFDAIGAFDVLEHIEEDETVLAQLYNALKPEGVLFLTVPQHPWLWSTVDDYACHVRRYTRSEIETKVRESGFEILRSTSFVSILLPVMMLSRELQKRKTEIVPADELKINAFLNNIFLGLLRFELAGIRIGLNYPAGGSRLVVARKLDGHLAGERS